MPTADSSPPSRFVARQAEPTPFERRRLWRALAAQRGLVLAAALLGLFGGALVSRLSVPLDHLACAEAHLAAVDAGAPARVLDDGVLQAARVLGRLSESVGELRTRLDVRARGSDIVVAAHATSAEEAVHLADAVVAAFVARESQRTQREQERVRARLDEELSRSQRELDRATRARSDALAPYGGAQPDADLAQARARLAELDAQIADARGRSDEALARGEVFAAGGHGRRAQKAGVELALAQRELSMSLAEHGEQHPDVLALRARIRRLQSYAVVPATGALGSRAEARAQAARASALQAERAAVEARITRLEQAVRELSPLDEARARASARVQELEARKSALEARQGPLAEVASRAQVQAVGRRGMRVAVAVLTPILALLVVVGVILASELRGFRVCAGTELAHWLGAPVVAVSAWPEHDAALEPLVDGLFDAAVDAPGVTLILPLSEAERPLAHTLAAHINRRAQRHFRSVTGARITLAQPWQGELSGTRLKRAAEVADRVLWVVAADHHQGVEIAERRTLLGRTQGVAAVLVEAEARDLPRAIGDTQGYWATRSEHGTGSHSAPAPRVPVH